MSTINGTSGNDTLNNTISGSVILAMEGDDSITNSGNKVSIDAGAGNDSVTNYSTTNSLSTGANVTISGGADDDFIENHGSNALVNGDSGNDTVNNLSNGVNATLNGGAGNDSIRNSSNAFISGGDGADSVINTNLGENSTINGDAGNDYILNGASNVSIDGGAGNDTLHSAENLQGITMSGGAGNDYLSNSASSKVYGGDGNDSIANSSLGANSTLSGDDGADYLQNAAKNVLIEGGAGSDSIYNTGANSTINGDADNDSIRNYGASVQIYGGAGNDTIINASLASNDTISGGVGNDYIRALSNTKVSLSGGTGDDSIIVSGVSQNITVNGGAGNDTLLGDSVNTYGVIYQYAAGDGNDRIYYYNSNDTISIGGDEIYETLTSGNNVNISLMSGSVTVVNAKGKNLNIVGGHLLAENEFVNTTTNTTINGTAAGDSISNYAGGVKIYAGDGNDTIYSQVLSATINNAYGYVTIDGGAGNDSIYADDPNISLNGGAGNDTISFYSSRGDITINGGTGNDYINNLTTNHAVIYQYEEGDGKDTITNYNSNDTISLSSSTVYETLESGNDIKVSIGSGEILLSSAKGKNLNIIGGTFTDTASSGSANYTKNTTFKGTTSADYMINYAGGVKVSAGAGNDTIVTNTDSNYTINNSYGYVTIDGGAGNDSIYVNDPYVSINGGAGNDTLSLNSTLNLTVKGGPGNDYITNNSTSRSGKLYQYSSSDGNDTITNYAATDTISIGGSIKYETVTSGNNIKVSLASGSILLSGAKGTALNIVGGKYAGTSSGGGSDTLPTGLSIKNSVLTASTAFTGSVLSAATYGVKNIDASALSRGIYINGDGNSNSLKGGKGADTITGAGGNDTVSLGGGNDVYIYSAGNDLIQDYTAGQDTIWLSSNISITSSSISGSDVIFNLSNSGKISVKGGKGKQITVNSKGKETTRLYGQYSVNSAATAITLNADFNGVLNSSNYDSTVTIIDATKTSKGGLIYGNTKDNSIVGGKGADSISGGAGKDTLWGGAGNDCLMGGDGNDIIFGEDGNDTILAGADNDYINGNAGNDYIDGGTGNDTIYGSAGNDTLNGGAGNDFIASSSGKDSLNGGDGNDTLRSASNDNATMTGGAGNDLFIYNSGNAVITDFNTAQDKISMANATISSASLKSSDLVLTTNKGTLTVKNGKDKEITVGDYIYYNNLIYDSKKTRVTVGAGFTGTLKADDYPSTVIFIDSTAVTKGLRIHGNDKADYIYAGSGADTIFGGAGNDWIYARNGDDEISGGTGNDVLYGDNGNDYLDGEAGNDTLYGDKGNDIFFYASGEGNDVIADYVAGEDKIYITSGSVSSISVASSDVIYKIGSNTLTVKNGKDKEIAIGNNIYYNNLIYDSKKTAITLGAGFSGTLKASDYSSSVKTIYAYNVTKDIVINGNANANTIYGSGWNKNTIYAGAGNDLIYGYSGNDILHGDAGNDTLYGGLGNDLLRGGAGNDYISGGEGNDTLDGDSGNDTLYGGNGNDTFRFYANEGNDVIADFTTNDKIYIGNGTISSASLNGSDMVFNVGSNTLTVKNGKDKEIAIGDKIYYNNLIYDSKKTAVTLGAGFTGSLTASSYSSSVKTIEAGNTKGATVNGNSNANIIYGSYAKDEIYGGAGNDILYGFGGNDNLFGEAGNDTLNGGAGNDLLRGGAGNDSLYGNDGDDLLDGDSGNDTLIGGAGNDTFRYYNGEGNDVITDYVAGEDKIYIASGSISSVSVKGSDVIYKIGSNTLTVKNGKGKDIQVGDLIYNNQFIYNSAKTEVTLAAGFSSSLSYTDYASTVTKVNAAYVSTGLSIRVGGNTKTVIGTDYNDNIYNTTSNAVFLDGGYGNDRLQGYPGNDTLFGSSGNDTLFGGYGNDYLSGGAGNDVFYDDYGGNDIIGDYTSGQDTIKFTHAITNTSYSGNNVIFSTSVGSFTVYNGKGKSITITDYNGKTTTKTYNTGVSARTLDLLEDNNFITDDTNLDSITEQKFNVTEIQNYKNEDLAQVSSILAYSEDK